MPHQNIQRDISPGSCNSVRISQRPPHQSWHIRTGKANPNQHVQYSSIPEAIIHKIPIYIYIFLCPLRPLLLAISPLHSEFSSIMSISYSFDAKYFSDNDGDKGTAFSISPFLKPSYSKGQFFEVKKSKRKNASTIQPTPPAVGSDVATIHSEPKLLHPKSSVNSEQFMYKSQKT